MTAAELAERLERGWALIDRTPSATEAQKLTDHFIALLHEYEAACGLDWTKPEHHERIAQEAA